MQNIIVTGENGKLSNRVAVWLNRKKIFNVTKLSLRRDFNTFDFNRVDCIVHVAGITPQNAKSEDDFENINYLLTKRLAEKAKNEGVKQFIFISTMAVYGLSQNINSKNGMVDSNTPCHPASEYGRSKLAAEKCLEEMKNENFNVCIIRVPSVYSYEKTEYMDQFKYLAEKYPIIPVAFKKNYKSFIHLDNLCELIFLIIKNRTSGIVCPDDGKFSAYDICHAIYPNKPKMRLAGMLIELFMRKNPRIIDYYGAIYYSEDLTNIYGGEYRVTDVCNAIKNLHAKSDKIK